MSALRDPRGGPAPGRAHIALETVPRFFGAPLQFRAGAHAKGRLCWTPGISQKEVLVTPCAYGGMRFDLLRRRGDNLMSIGKPSVLSTSSTECLPEQCRIPMIHVIPSPERHWLSKDESMRAQMKPRIRFTEPHCIPIKFRWRRAHAPNSTEARVPSHELLRPGYSVAEA